MTEKIQNKKITLDATDQSVGRLASKVAKYLIGKESTEFARNQVFDIKVEVINASKVKIIGKKIKDSVHKRYSGYPSGLKEDNWEKVATEKGYKEIIRKAVDGMLPKNKLRDERLKNLTVTE